MSTNPPRPPGPRPLFKCCLDEVGFAAPEELLAELASVVAVAAEAEAFLCDETSSPDAVGVSASTVVAALESGVGEELFFLRCVAVYSVWARANKSKEAV